MYMYIYIYIYVYMYIYISISVSVQLFFIEECSITSYSWQEQNMRDGKK